MSEPTKKEQAQALTEAKRDALSAIYERGYQTGLDATCEKLRRLDAVLDEVETVLQNLHEAQARPDLLLRLYEVRAALKD